MSQTRKRPRAGTLGLLAAAAAVALLLSSCSGDALGGLVREHGASADGSSAGGEGPHSTKSDVTDEGTPISSLRPAASPALTAFDRQVVHWTPCHHVFKCGTVRVPIDWQHIGTASIKIALIMHPATGSLLGDLVVNPGGPGGSGVEFVEEGVDGVVDGSVAQHYNVIGFDPRGVGASAPVTCYDDAGTDKYFYDIDPGAVGSKTWIAAEEKKSRDLAAACARNTGPVLAHIDSISVAQDLDVIRAAVRQPKLNYLGYSYGTYLGTLYAGLFPNRVGRTVLDGADDPWGSDYQISDPSGGSGSFGVGPNVDGTVGQTIGFESSLVDYLRGCLSNTSTTVGRFRCPFTSTLARAKVRVEQEFARVNAHPLVTKDGRKLGGATLATAIDDALYDSSDWPALTRMFVQLEDGNPAQAFEFADEYNDRNPDGTYSDNDDFAHLAIGCIEDGNDVDLSFDRREAAELRKVAPMLGIYSAYGDLICSGWRYSSSPFPNPIHARGTGPILVLGNTGDPATPYSDAVDLARQLDNGHLVTLHGEGHTSYDLGNGCIDRTVDDYLLSGAVPDRDPDCH
ncbi:MAG TPA: alpha/beta hydrolase [Galbitalea sp.]|jgi:pimeloyl-ACP methyl ester carboxylesterase|nr:alpha/beta hydrolase [Galbitalea sp.]